VPLIRKTAELVQEVATASREQAAGVAQVNRAMGQVDLVTQGNAAAAEELSATAEQVAHQAGKLQEIISRFRLDGMKLAQTDRDMADSVEFMTRSALTDGEFPHAALESRIALATARRAALGKTPPRDPSLAGIEEL
jgi:hypothetical protein